LEVIKLLSVRNVSVSYGKSVAVEDVSLEVIEGSVVSIVGANGSGKSTVLRAVSGLKAVASGEIWFRGSRMNGLGTTEIVRRGISLVPEGRQLFPYLTVLNNLKLGASLCRERDEMSARLEEVYTLFPRLLERRNQKAGTLSGGEQQMVAIGRGLMAKPKLLCMDEPSLGLAPIVIEQLGEVIRNINKKGVTVLLVEQNVHLALGVASRGYALQVGKVVLEGDIDTIKTSQVVRKAYLGG
jgi:branched-chain amino acid transport system ATP-binding protein